MGTITRMWRAAVLAAAVVVVVGGPALAQPWVDSDHARQLQQQESYADAARAYAAIVKSNPFDGQALSQLGYCLHASKNYEEALKAYAKAVDMGYGRPTNLYNSACACALLGRKDEALKRLELALNARFADQETLENDTDLDSLRDDPRFAALTGITRGLATKPAATREAGWAWDLDFYCRRMKQMHWDLYAKVPEPKFHAEVEQLKHDAPTLSDSQVRARLRKITALVGDGHTASRLSPEGEARSLLPLHMFQFKDGLFIIGADASHPELVGARVLKVGSLDTDAALAAVRPYICVDNEMGYLAQSPSMLTNPTILQAIGATPDESGVQVTVKTPAGETKTARVEPASFPADRHAGFLMPGFTYVHDHETGSRPLYLHDPDKPLRMEHLPESKTVYFWFGAVADSKEATFKDFVQDMFKFIDKNGVENLVIDMRFNGGGNTGLIKPLIYGLIRNETINRKGHLWVIIGRHTFSAAQNTVNFIEQNTQATFVGEPTGSRPAFVGESTSFVLPHSHTRVFCSSRYWQQMDSTDERTWVQPEIAAEMTFADYAANRDPAMDAIMKWVKPGTGSTP